MPDPTTPIDYTTKTKAELVELLQERDRDLANVRLQLRSLDEELRANAAELEALAARAEEDARVEQARRDERAKAREARGPAKLLGKIDLYDIDDPDDVLERAKAVRAGRVPASIAKRWKTDAHYRAPIDSALAKRLGTREVPIGTEFDREELPELTIDALNAAGAIIPIG